jgi:hypothetical protein
MACSSPRSPFTWVSKFYLWKHSKTCQLGNQPTKTHVPAQKNSEPEIPMLEDRMPQMAWQFTLSQYCTDAA